MMRLQGLDCRRRWCLPVGLLLTLLEIVASQSTGIYTVVAPKVLRPNSDYHVAVSIHETPEPVFVTVEIEGIQDAGGRIHSRKQQQIDSGDTRILQFPMGDLGQGSYNISVSGTGGIRFTNTTALEYIHKSLSVFIQTDKAIYKPGQKVMFRAIVVDRKLRPSATTRIDVFVTDGKQHRVKQFKRAFTNKGVFSGEVELSDQPVLGDWNITVNVLGQEFTKSFKVAEYVLPKFEVDITLPPYATFKDSEVVPVITARYTYGKPVKGEATVSVSPLYKSPYLQPFFDEPLRKVVPIDGRATVKFNLLEELRLTDDFQREILFDVTVEEALTGRRQNTSGSVKLFKYPYKLELIKTADTFKPGLKYSAFLKVAMQDDTPVQDAVGKVIVRHGFTYNEDDFESAEHWIPPNGLVPLTFFPPAVDDIHVLSIEAEYKDLKEFLTSVVRAQSPSHTYVQADLKTENPKVNDQVEIEVRSTKPMRSYVYEVLGRGNIVFAQTVQANDQTNHTFRFPCLLEMSPRARVLVYFTTETGEVVADSIMFEADGTFQNKVEIEVEPESRPGKNVKVTVKSEQDSYVGILGIDQSVLLLKTGNDITKDNVISELESYDSGRSKEDSPLVMFKRRKRSAFWPGSATASDVFEETGVVVLTNGYVYEAKQFVFYRSGGFDVDGRLLEMSATANIATSSLEHQDDVNAVADSDAQQKSQGPRLRRNFEETWLWQNLDIGSGGTGTITSMVPDSITSWVITAFSVHSLNGLGITEEPAKLRVFKPFFVTMNYPYSVIRGETLSLQVVVFNYQSKNVEAEIILENEKKEFEFLGIESNDVSDAGVDQKMMKKVVVVNANDGATVTFVIRPLKVGNIDLKVTARSRVAEDSVLRQLLVKAEGAEQYRNKAVLVNLQNSNTFRENVTIDIPRTAVNDSFFIEVSAVGDIMGPAIRNLGSLLKLPYGCGEQNMLNFVPNVVVYEYLQNINQLDEATRTRAKRFIEIGYQRELTYMRDDHSFSAFGNADASGSTWLTAFVIRSFNQANALPDVDIDESIILKSLSWLAGVQTRDGAFPEVGKVSHKAMQGGNGKGLALTAYAAIAFLETEELTKGEYRNVLNKALNHLAGEMTSVSDWYTWAVLNYAFHLAKHHYRERLFNLMEGVAKTREDMKYWAVDVPEPAADAPWIHQAVSVDIEMTSYMLMTYVMRNLVTESLPIMNWLVNQRNAQGGFASTQDTVVGLAALGKLAERLSFRNTEMEITIVHDDPSNQRRIPIKPDTLMTVVKHELPGTTRWVEITASKGRGMALVQVSYKFNLNASAAYPSFSLDPQIDHTADKNHLRMSICTRYEDSDAESNMAIMEVNLPSGYTVDTDSLPSVREYPAVRRVETHDGNTNMVIYFDKIGRSEVCPTISAYRTFPVADQKPVPVTVRDYYDHSRQARAFYQTYQANICDICEGDGCARAGCREVASGGREGQSTASTISSSAIVTLAGFFAILMAWNRL